jgi:hypothetical protein
MRLRTPRKLIALTICVGWVVCLAFAINSSSNCTPSNPSVCGPDPRFGVALGFWAVVPLLVWVLPVTGSLAATAFAIFDVAFDPDRELRVIFGIFGVLCAGIAVLVLVRRRAQAALAGERDDSGTPIVVNGNPGAARSVPPAALLVAVMLGAGAVGLFVGYHLRTASEATHVRAAQRTVATVVTVDSTNTEIVVQLPSGTSHRISVADAGPYRVNTEEPILLDPADASWVRLVAEPADFTFWLTGAWICILLGLVVVAGAVAASRARKNLTSSPQASLRARVRFGREGVVYVFAEDDQRAPPPIASFRIVPVPATILPAPTRERFDDPWEVFLPPPPTSVTLRGTFADAGYMCIATPDGIVLPRTRVKAVGARQRALYAKAMSSSVGVESAINIEPDASASPVSLDASREVFRSDPAMRVPALPLVVPIGRGRSATAIAMAGAGFVVAAVAGFLIPISDGRLLVLPIALGAQAVIGGVGRYRSATVLTHRGLTVRGFWSTTSLAWTDVASVARVRDYLLVALQRGTVFRLGPFAAEPGSDRYHRAQELGAAITVLRDRAVAIGGSSQPVSAKLSVGPTVIGAYMSVAVLAMWLGSVLR